VAQIEHNQEVVQWPHIVTQPFHSNCIPGIKFVCQEQEQIADLIIEGSLKRRPAINQYPLKSFPIKIPDRYFCVFAKSLKRNENRTDSVTIQHAA